MTTRAILLSLLLLPAWLPAQAEDPSTEEARAPAGDGCFRIRKVSGWSPIDDRHLYLEEDGGDRFLVTLATACPGIRFATAIALSNRTGRVCPGDFGQVTYRGGGMRSGCRIRDIERVGSKDEASERAGIGSDGE